MTDSELKAVYNALEHWVKTGEESPLLKETRVAYFKKHNLPNTDYHTVIHLRPDVVNEMARRWANE